MFGKVIVFRLFEMIQIITNKKRVRIASPGQVRYDGTGHHNNSYSIYIKEYCLKVSRVNTCD